MQTDTADNTSLEIILSCPGGLPPTWMDGQTSPLEAYSRDSRRFMHARVGEQLSAAPERHKYTTQAN